MAFPNSESSSEINVKCEEVKSLSVNSNGHLYHIIRANGFTFCLICLEDISNSIDDVGKHLGSENHQENIKRLFQACNPNLRIDNDERFLDLVSRSVFDISVLLGKETCYICERDGSWFCVICEKNITKIINSDKIVKNEIIDHVLSEDHVSRTKDVCFMYRLNSDKDFLLLHKSIVYCSLCKEVIQCREVDLLNNALVHSEATKHPKITRSSTFPNQTSDLFKKEARFCPQIQNEIIMRSAINSKSVSSHNIVDDVKDEIIDNPSCYDEDIFANEKEMFSNDDLKSNCKEDRKYFDEEQFCKDYICTCLLCKKKVSHLEKGVVVAVNKHFNKEHHKLYPRMSLKGMMYAVIFHNKPDEIKLISQSLSIRKIVGRTRWLGRNAKYIFRTKNCYFCVVCMVDMPQTKDVKALLQVFKNHFYTFEHQLCVDEKININQSFNIDSSEQTVRRLMIKREDLIERVIKRKKKLKMKRERKRKRLLLQS